MSTPHDNHYAPQFYLRNFACDHNKHKVEAVTKHNSYAIWSETSVRGIGYEVDYYSDPASGYSHENDLKRDIEDPLVSTKTWDKIQSNRGELIDISDKANIYSFIRHLHFRTPHSEQTAKELARMAESHDPQMEFEESERDYYKYLHDNPQTLKMLANLKSSIVWWTPEDIYNSYLAIYRSPVRLATTTTPVHTISIGYDPRLFLPLPGMKPHQLLLPLGPNIMAALVLGNFKNGFDNVGINFGQSETLTRHYVAQFAYFPMVKHLLIPRLKLVEHMTWAPYDLISESKASVRFKRRQP